MRTRVLLLGVVAATLAGGAGLGLAQDQNSVANQVQNATDNVITPSTLDIPPPEEAPAPPPEEPPPAPRPPENTVANAVAETPEAPPPTPKRPRYATVVLQALDKVTAETLRFEAKVNEPVRYKDLVIIVHACETQAADEPYAQTAAHVEVQYQPEVLGGRAAKVAHQVFRGWMFGDAPGLNPFENPVYDLWVIACKTPSTPASAAAPTPGASL